MSSKSDLESEVAALKKQLAQIRDQSSHVADRLAERANGYVGDAVNSGRSRAQAAYQNGVQTAQDAYETGVQTAHDLAVDTAVRAREAEDTMANTIRERPFLSVGLAFAAGMVLCRMSSAGRRS